MAVSPVVDVSDVEMTKNEHIYDPGCGVTIDISVPPLQFGGHSDDPTGGDKSRREGRREGLPLSSSLPPGVDSSDAKRSKKEHICDPTSGVKSVPTAGVIYMLIFGHLYIRDINSKAPWRQL